MASEKQQRQKELRHAKREAERKAAQRKETFRRIRTALGLGLLVALVLVVVPALTDGEDGLPPDYQALRDQPTACGADQPPPSELVDYDAPGDADLTDGATATLVTSCGGIVIGFVYEEGVVAMAKTPASNSTGSQFFIVHGSQGAILSPTFNVIGRVVSGMDTVDRIAEIETVRGSTRENSKPTETAYIESILIDQ
jgi:cyclophilin family peptidyl-prolyl cis-trans isomerase